MIFFFFYHSIVWFYVEWLRVNLSQSSFICLAFESQVVEWDDESHDLVICFEKLHFEFLLKDCLVMVEPLVNLVVLTYVDPCVVVKLEALVIVIVPDSWRTYINKELYYFLSRKKVCSFFSSNPLTTNDHRQILVLVLEFQDLNSTVEQVIQHHLYIFVSILFFYFETKFLSI